jgi:hypothetical protein
MPTRSTPHVAEACCAPSVCCDFQPPIGRECRGTSLACLSHCKAFQRRHVADDLIISRACNRKGLVKCPTTVTGAAIGRGITGRPEARPITRFSEPEGPPGESATVPVPYSTGGWTLEAWNPSDPPTEFVDPGSLGLLETTCVPSSV